MDDVIRKFVEIAPNSGFTQSTLVESCILCGRSCDVFRFTSGVFSLLELIEEEINRQSCERFASLGEVNGISKRMERILIIRLELYCELVNYRQFLKEKLKFFTSVKNSSRGVKDFYHAVDFMWKVVGGSYEGFTFYTKRITLYVLYVRVIKKFINDYSMNFVDTRVFIHHQLQKISDFAKMKSRIVRIFN